MPWRIDTDENHPLHVMSSKKKNYTASKCTSQAFPFGNQSESTWDRRHLGEGREKTGGVQSQGRVPLRQRAGARGGGTGSCWARVGDRGAVWKGEGRTYWTSGCPSISPDANLHTKASNCCGCGGEIGTGAGSTHPATSLPPIQSGSPKTSCFCQRSQAPEPKSAPSAIKISKHRHLYICSSKNSTGFPWLLEWQGGQLQNSNSRVGRSGHEQVVGVYVEREEVRSGRTKQYVANSTVWLPTVTTAYNTHSE